MRKLSNHIYRLLCLILALVGLLSGATLALGPARRASAQVVGPSWSLTGSLNTARHNHTATLLANGKVLVAGGMPDRLGPFTYLNTAELYDPATGTWSYTGNLNTGRSSHTATLLASGQVLVTGGEVGNDQFTNSAELYDPATGTWSVTGNLNLLGADNTATLLANGKVLAAGGCCDLDGVKRAEIYDPATGTWSITGNLNTGRFAHTATLLPSGKVLVVGSGFTSTGFLNSAELYDPATGTWSSAGNLNTVRALHTATLLANGQVLVAGGVNDIGKPNNILNSAELYDPATGTWSVTGNLNAPREIHTATLLPNGQVLVAGGCCGPARNSAELYDPTTGIWGSAAKLIDTAHADHTATLLPKGKALVVGTSGSGRNLAELFDLGLTQPEAVVSVSAASFSLMGLASEAIAAGFGAGLATTSIGATALPLPTQLGGTTVKVKDSAGAERLAPLFFVSPTQVNYQIPAGTAAGAITVTITSGDGTASTGVALVNTVAPSLFTANGNGQGVAAALALRIKADGSQSYEPVAQFDAAQNRFVARPLDLGPETDQVYLALFGTGIRQRNSLSSAIATIGGAYAEVSFAGAQGDFAGLDQINVLVPRSLAGRGEIDILLTVEAQMANAAPVNIK